MIDVWKTHPDVEEILSIQARNKSDTVTSSERELIQISSDEEENIERKEETGSSESGDDSDNESDDEDDEKSETEITASNKFALLGEED